MIQQLNQVHTTGQIPYEIAFSFGIKETPDLSTGKVKDSDFVNAVIVIELEETVGGIGENPDLSPVGHGIDRWPDLCVQACCV